MKLFSLLCATFVLAPAMAGEMVAHQGSNTIRLGDDVCSVPAVLQRLEPELHAQFRAATAVVEGQPYSACWRITPAGAHLIYEDGDQGIVPFRSLRSLVTI